MTTNRSARGLVYLILFLAIIGIIWSINRADTPNEIISVTELAQAIRAEEIRTIEVEGDGRSAIVTYTNDETALVRTSAVSSLEELLTAYGIQQEAYADGQPTITYRPASNIDRWLTILALIVPALLIGFFIFFMFRQAQGSNNQAMAFGKSKARLLDGDHPTITFDDVAGAEEAKHELEEIVEFLREPEKFVSFGARIPKGVLLVGSPGTGKTLLAKAVSGEAGVPFFSIAGSEFVEMFVGVGASRVRDLFEQARRHSPCIIFIDEIDAVGRQRGAGLGGSHDEREQTLNQILVEMDGFGTDTHVIILAATNRPDILDPALMRPGRFDRRVIIDKPDIRGREAIFRVHLRGKPIASNVNVDVLARSTPGFAGADIENTVNEAALLAARRNKRSISMDEFNEAVERVQLGPERKSRVISAEEREITAYHEAGHAVVSHFLPADLPLRKVTIIPRGMAGGLTWYMQDDQMMQKKSSLEARIISTLGGRVAEEIVFGEITTGASNDLQRVTAIAQQMVTQLGMSENLGLRVYGQKQEMVFLGREISEQRDYSDEIARQIDEEVRRIIDQSYERAVAILTENRDKLDLIAQTLLEIETLEANEFAALMDGRGLPPSARGKRPSAPSNNAKDQPSKGVSLDSSALDMPPSPA